MKTIIIIALAFCLKLAYPQSNTICLDTTEFKGLELTIVENGMLNSVNQTLKQEIKLYRDAEMFYKDKIQSLTAIIKLKDDQIKKLEGVKIPVINKSNDNWYWYMAGGSAITVIGYLVYKVLVKK